MSQTTTAAAAAEAEKTGGDVQITELASIEPTRVDGVGTPANGFPILMMKSIAAPAAIEKTSAAGCGCCGDCTCDHGTAKQVGDSTTTAPKAKKAKAAGKKAAKSATMPEGDPNASSKDAAITPDVIAKAVAEATAPFQAEIKTLREQMAKVLATPIPGGPVLVTPQTPRAEAPEATARAERLRAIAKQTSDPETRASYLALAAREEGAPITKE